MALRPGDLRNQVTLRRPTQTRNADGGYATTWTDIATVWAQVLGISGREAVIGQALQGLSFFKIAMRYRTDVTDDMQLVFEGRELNIRSATDPDGRREQLLILADTGSAQKTS